jgi:hypothetical protein
VKEVAFAFLANSAELLADGRLVVIGPDIDQLFCVQIPTSAQLSFVVKLIFAAEESSRSHTVAIEYAKPDGTRARLTQSIPLSLRLNPGNPAADVKTAVVAVLGLNLDAPGGYTFYVMVDEQDAVNRPLNVTVFSPSGASVLTGSTPCP